MPPRTIFHEVMQGRVAFVYFVRSIIFNFFDMFLYTLMTEKYVVLKEILKPASELFLKYS